MPSKLTLAAGVLGVASLAFVGVGGYAAFTSQADLSTQATAGTFILNASVGKTGEYCPTGNQQQSCLFFDAPNYASPSGSLPANIGQVAVNTNNSIITPNGTNASWAWTVPNMAPGDSYYADVKLFDAGTLQGKVYEVTYTPPKSSTLTAAQQQLLSDLSVTVEEKTSSGWDILPQMSNDFGNNGSGDKPANGSYTFGTAVSGGNVPFLQPVAANPTDEQVAEFRVIFTLADSATNAVETQTVAPTLTFVGTSLP